MLLNYSAGGKLLITGEYFVLNGAAALAVPTKSGQQLEITSSPDDFFNWHSLDENGNTWLTAQFGFSDLQLLNNSDAELANKLQSILRYIKSVSPTHFEKPLTFTTKLGFDRSYGWGTSSTLVSLLSQWSVVNAFDILQNTLGGSGYDIACATAKGPIVYQLVDNKPTVQKAPFPTHLLNNLFLVYQGNKQSSSQEIKKYQDHGVPDPSLIRQISHLTQLVARSADLGTLCACIQELERHTGDFMGREPIQDNLFKNLAGAAKSLGAWGGDFVLLATPWPENKVRQFCNDLGLNTVFKFEDIVKL